MERPPEEQPPGPEDPTIQADEESPETPGPGDSDAAWPEPGTEPEDATTDDGETRK